MQQIVKNKYLICLFSLIETNNTTDNFKFYVCGQIKGIFWGQVQTITRLFIN